MSSLNHIYEKMLPTLPTATFDPIALEAAEPHPAKEIGRDVAHELNNILTIIQGYADNVLRKHGAEAVWRPELQLICSNARRAVAVIKSAPRTREHEKVGA